MSKKISKLQQRVLALSLARELLMKFHEDDSGTDIICGELTSLLEKYSAQLEAEYSKQYTAMLEQLGEAWQK